MSDAVALAEHLLELVKSVAQAPGTTSNGTDEQNLTTWNTKIQIQNVCDQLLLKTMGPAECTVLLAGQYFNTISRISLIVNVIPRVLPGESSPPLRD